MVAITVKYVLESSLVTATTAYYLEPACAFIATAGYVLEALGRYRPRAEARKRTECCARPWRTGQKPKQGRPFPHCCVVVRPSTATSGAIQIEGAQRHSVAIAIPSATSKKIWRATLPHDATRPRACVVRGTEVK